MLLQKNIVKKYLALLPDEQTQEAWKWVREPSLDPSQAWVQEWDNLYLIGTFPSLQLNIDDYPAIKNYLLSFGFERLEQSGAKGSRKKTQNKWFETQDSISYCKEFSKPKIMYPNMTSLFPFIGIMGTVLVIIQ